MHKTALWGLIAFYLLTGIFLVMAPHTFYTTAPGVTETGPYNMHFVRDVGFAFTVSALAMAYGVRESIRPLVLFGASWLVIHGLFHLVLILLHAHFNTAALVDFAVVVVPALLVAVLALTFKEPAHA